MTLSQVTCDTLLSAGRYVVVPVSLRPRSNDASSGRGLEYVLRIGSAKPLLCEASLVSEAEYAASIAAYVKQAGKPHHPFSSMVVYTRHDGAGWLTYAENRSRMQSFSVQLDQSGSFNVLTSRGSLTT